MSVLGNARLVLDDEVRPGAVTMTDGRIAAIGLGAGTALIGQGAGTVDLEGDYLIPGIIDLHTDNLERQVLPRNNARWPSRSALLAHDAQCAGAGITTVFDALCLGDIGFETARNDTFENGYVDIVALAKAGVLKTEHFLHLRCELPAPEMPEMLMRVIDDPLVRLVSIMDHSPGIGQYADVERYRKMRLGDGFTGADVDEMIGKLQQRQAVHHPANRALVLREARRRGIPIASHDDRTDEEVARNAREDIGISEFPVSLLAARAAHGRGQAVIAGAPNIVRGGSHSGNVAVLDLIRENLLDALASDYVPAAMLEAAFCTFTQNILSLPRAMALVSRGPAAIAGLADRGRIAVGLLADLVQVRMFGDLPVIRAVWRQGVRIA